MREDLRRLDGRIESLEMEGDRIREDLDYTRREQGRTASDQVEDLRLSLEGLEKRMGDLEKARARDREELVEKVTQTVTALMQQRNSGVSRQARKPRSASEYGYEHTVEPGQTLSAIAQAYDVSTARIIEANDLENPDRLRVGQVLFIPE